MVSRGKAKFEYDYRSMKTKSINKDHDQDGAEDSRVIDDQVEARPKYDREASNIADCSMCQYKKWDISPLLYYQTYPIQPCK